MKGYSVYSQIQQLKEQGFRKDAVARNLGINWRTANRYWDMTVEEYEARKTAYLENADAKIILYAYTQNKLGKPVTVVSEESSAGNDDKMYKKIPTICNAIGINCIQLPELLRRFGEIQVKF